MTAEKKRREDESEAKRWITVTAVVCRFPSVVERKTPIAKVKATDKVKHARTYNKSNTKSYVCVCVCVCVCLEWKQ